MNNIFENAYFGKPYKTRDGRKAIFLQVNNCAKFVIDFGFHVVTHDYKLDGTSLFGCNNLNIVDEWEEPIDEEKACEWLNDNLIAFVEYDHLNGICIDYSQLNKQFRIAMEK